MTDRLTEVAAGVLVATGALYTTTTTVVAGPGGTCLVIDPAVTVAELTGLAASLAGRGLRPVIAWSTHAHWDHLLWHPTLGDVPRYATARTVSASAANRDANLAELAADAPGHDLSLFGAVTALDGSAIPWAGPSALVIEHDGHAPGHGAVFLPQAGVLVAGDMCSDIEFPLLDLDAADPAGDYRTGLDRLASTGGVRLVVPGHGHVGDAAELGRRVSLDLEYLDRLERGGLFGDPRVTEPLRSIHETQLTHFAASGTLFTVIALLPTETESRVGRAGRG